MFESLGLSKTAELVYRAMLSQPALGVAELTAHTGLSAEEIRQALDSLAEMALVRSSWQAPGLLRPTSPQVGLAVLIAQAEAKIAQRQQEIEAARAAIRVLAETHSSHLRRDELIRWEELDGIRVRLEELATSACTECLSFSPGAAHKPDAMAASKPLNQLALERGVSIRAVYQDSFRNDPQTLAYARWFSELGAQTRTVPTVPFQMVIVDREIALLPSDPGDPQTGAIEVHSPGVVAALCVMFEHVWATATPFGTAAQTDVHGLEPQERELLRLLGDGHTDESAARKLGLSVRTIQRMMADLTSRLGAESRFQAGANAIRQGWL
ncbi:LuxR family transcriptional regulator [Actinocrinis puniceicyclus]|uniref:LuxR family transcriptional regulator n=1 Tax=Actinocrinis puniceicyclus TaxID=977794 RepID=A0A8J8BE43_9ACTN|nr:LuxR family transcriptional regulator [Actinocrinis puniceicyclus]MBS2965963.1 LuxR family transcriptional regulator [Actinocrinis puniceicyclus]